MRTELMHIMREYRQASHEPFAGHPLAAFIRGEAADALRLAIGSDGAELRVIGAPGLGQWADSPWLGVLDPEVTLTPQDGYYVTYLFPKSMNSVYLSLQLGTTRLRHELGSDGARAELARRIRLIRERIPEHSTRFPNYSIDLHPTGTSSRASFYESAHAFGKGYLLELPSDADLQADAKDMAKLYRILRERGGIV